MENLQYIKPRQKPIASLLEKKLFTIFVVPPVKALLEDQVDLGQEDCLTTTFGLFANGAAKLINLVVSCSDPFD